MILGYRKVGEKVKQMQVLSSIFEVSFFAEKFLQQASLDA